MPGKKKCFPQLKKLFIYLLCRCVYILQLSHDVGVEVRRQLSGINSFLCHMGHVGNQTQITRLSRKHLQLLRRLTHPSPVTREFPKLQGSLLVSTLVLMRDLVLLRNGAETLNILPGFCSHDTQNTVIYLPAPFGWFEPSKDRMMSLKKLRNVLWCRTVMQRRAFHVGLVCSVSDGHSSTGCRLSWTPPLISGLPWVLRLP